MSLATSRTAFARDSRLSLAGAVGFAVALAAASHVAIPVPGTPVPFTLQPVVVVLAGIWLGPVYGAASMLLYIAAGIAGFPVFAPMGAPGIARLIGPAAVTGGYILAYPVAAFVAGRVVARRATFAWRVAAAAGGIAIIHLGGVAQLALITGSLASALALGLKPFIVFDLLKALVAGLAAPTWSDRATD
ncbi:MAG: biotin transporter BioY [Gemmatimonadaceae bacterium]